MLRQQPYGLIQATNVKLSGIVRVGSVLGYIDKLCGLAVHVCTNFSLCDLMRSTRKLRLPVRAPEL